LIANTSGPRSTLSWWEAQRLPYNCRILLGFAIAWLGMATAAFRSGADWDRNVFFQTSGVLESLTLLTLVSIVSNLLYFAGPAVERVLSLPKPTGLRRALFTILWVLPVCLMLAFAVRWASDVLENPSLLDGGQPE
jgi:hypothetical protein